MSAPERRSRVVKGAPPPGDEPHPVGPDPVAAARVRAEEILSAARADAAAILSSAVEEVRAARAAAVGEGHAEGMGRAAAAFAQAAEARATLVADAEEIVLQVALEVARRVLEREIEGSPAWVIEAARRALAAAPAGGEVRLRVAPGDLATVQGAGEVLVRAVERGTLIVIEDRELERGEVVVEAAGTLVDGRIEAQLEPFRRALRAEAP